MTDAISIPDDLKPADGRFGAGPSKIQTSHLDALAATGVDADGYVAPPGAGARARSAGSSEGLATFFDLPDGYEVVLGNGGATAFWDVATYGLIREKSQHLSSGSSPRSSPAAARPRPGWPSPSVVASEPGLAPRAGGRGGRRRLRVAAQRDLDRGDGAGTPGAGRRRRRPGPDRRDLRRRRAAGRPDRGRRLLLRAAEGLRLRRRPLHRAACRRPALERASRSRRAAATSRRSSTWSTAIDNSRLNQTYNTPSIATFFLMAEQLDWMNANGCLTGMVERTTASSDALYGWAEKTAYTTPYVADPDHRSLVIGTIDFDDAIDAVCDRRHPARQRHRRHRALPQARPQPAADRDVPRRRPRRRRGPHRLHRLRGRAPLTGGPDRRPGHRRF